MGDKTKIRYLVPNSFTALSLLLAVFSIFFTLDSKSLTDPADPIRLAGWIIVWCALLDKIDGIAARLMNATSNFGVEFDSFADFVAFGLAPGFLVYQVAALEYTANPTLPLELRTVLWLFQVAAAFYILCAGIRLATFNVRTSVNGPDWFYGFPSTFNGAVIAAIVLTAVKYDFAVTIAPYLPLVLVPLGVMMLVPLRLPKVKARKNRLFNVFQATAGSLIYIFGLLRLFPELLLVLGSGYLLIGGMIGLMSPRATTPQPTSAALARQKRPRRGIWWWRRRRGGVAEMIHVQGGGQTPSAKDEEQQLPVAEPLDPADKP